MKQNSSLAMLFALLLTVIGSTATQSRCSGSEPLRDSLGEAAQQIQDVLRSVNSTSVSIGLFTPGIADKIAPYGRRIAEFLSEELQHLNVDVSDKSSYGVKGEYLLDSDTGRITIEFQVVDSKGRKLGIVISDAPIQTEVLDEKERLLVSHISTATLPIDPSGKPGPVSAPQNGAADSDLIIENNFLILPSVKIGVRLIEIDPGQSTGGDVKPIKLVPIQTNTAPHYLLNETKSYAIEIANLREDVDFAAEVYFDGINTFSLCDRTPNELVRDRVTGREFPRFQYWKINRRSSQLVPGWYKNLNTVNAFQVVPDEQSVAYRLKRPAGIGTLQVIVKAAWPEGEFVDDSLRAQRRKGGIGEGESIDVALKPESLEIGAILGSICIQYKTTQSIDR